MIRPTETGKTIIIKRIYLVYDKVKGCYESIVGPENMYLKLKKYEILG